MCATERLLSIHKRLGHDAGRPAASVSLQRVRGYGGETEFQCLGCGRPGAWLDHLLNRLCRRFAPSIKQRSTLMSSGNGSCVQSNALPIASPTNLLLPSGMTLKGLGSCFHMWLSYSPDGRYARAPAGSANIAGQEAHGARITRARL